MYKKEGHKNEATFENKIDGNIRRDHLWILWCKPETHKAIFVLPAGAKTQKLWCWRKFGKDKNTDKNTNKGLLKLNPSLLYNSPFSNSLSRYMPSFLDVTKHSLSRSMPLLDIMNRTGSVKRKINILDQSKKRERETKSEMKLSERNVTAKNVTSKNINL